MTSLRVEPQYWAPSTQPPDSDAIKLQLRILTFLPLYYVVKERTDSQPIRKLNTEQNETALF